MIFKVIEPTQIGIYNSMMVGCVCKWDAPRFYDSVNWENPHQKWGKPTSDKTIHEEKIQRRKMVDMQGKSYPLTGRAWEFLMGLSRCPAMPAIAGAVTHPFAMG